MPTAHRRRLDPLDPDADLDQLSSDELEESVFGPDPSRPRERAPRRRTAPRPPATKFCHACAETLDARAEICPACGVRQPALPGRRTRRDRNTAVLLALVSVLIGGFCLHKFYLGHTAAGILSVLFVWTGIPWIVSVVNFVQYLKTDDDEFAERYG